MTSPRLLFRVVCALAALLSFAPSQSSSSADFPEVECKYLPVQDSAGKWWQTLQVKTLPGVVYRLEQSGNLESWTTVANRYGMSELWVCRLFPAPVPPVETLPQQTPTLPEEPDEPVRQVSLVLERNAAGEAVISWISLDDGLAKQKVLSGVVLNPVLNGHEGFYQQPHGNFFLGMKTSLLNPVEITGDEPVLGSLDEALLATLSDAMPQVMANIQNQAAAANAYSHADAAASEKMFYRVVADFGRDTNGDGIDDWRQWSMPGGNALLTGMSDGPNNPLDPSNPNPGMPPSGGGSTLPQYKPKIEQRHFKVSVDYADSLSDPPFGMTRLLETDLFKIWLNTQNSFPDNAFIKLGKKPAEDEKNPVYPKFSEFRSVFESIALPEQAGVEWKEQLTAYGADNYTLYGGYMIGWRMSQVEFRVKLEQPAPAGGYNTVLPFLKVIRSYDEYSNITTSTSSYERLLLHVPAGLTQGPSVRGPLDANLSANQSVTYTPLFIHDNIEASGVDKDSITIPLGSPGHQDKFWIMAPEGGSGYTNDMHFGDSLWFYDPIKVTCDGVSIKPDKVKLNGADAPVSWRATAGAVGEKAPVFKIEKEGDPTTILNLPIGVKTMKKRTVNVAVFPVKCKPGRRDVPVPPQKQMEDKLNRIFGWQLNAWFKVKIMPQVTYDYDPHDEGFLEQGSGQEYNMISNGAFAVDDKQYDIRILLVDGDYVVSRASMSLVNGQTIDWINLAIIDARRDTFNDVCKTIAHEIGHVMIGPGHPDLNNGPAPFPGTDHSVRLMVSTPQKKESMLLVKAEWDAAESWLKKRPFDK